MTRRSQPATRVLGLARAEAEWFGHRYVGPEHLVLGVLRDDRSDAARVLRAHGLSQSTARAALGRLAERGLVPGPRPSDAELLGTLGIDLDAIRHRTEQAFGANAVGWAVREATRAVRLGRPAQPLPGRGRAAARRLRDRPRRARRGPDGRAPGDRDLR